MAAEGGIDVTPVITVIRESEAAEPGERTAPAMDAWRECRGTAALPATNSESSANNVVAPVLKPTATIQRLVGPLMHSARIGLTSVGMLSPRQQPRIPALTQWLRDFDGHVAMVKDDLRDVGL